MGLIREFCTIQFGLIRELRVINLPVMKNLKILSIALLIISFATPIMAKADNMAMNHLIKAYLGIKDALATDDSKAANEQAKLFVTAVKEVNSTPGMAKNTTWTKYAEQLRFNGDHISESASFDHQREHFGKLSDDFYAVVKALQTNNITLYRQYCPMKKQYWLSQSATILNPYYGKSMSECGQVKETLKGK